MSRSSLPSVAMVNAQCLNELIITCLWLNTAKTIHPSLSKYSFTKQEGGMGCLFELGWGGYFIFWPIHVGGVLIPRGAYLRGDTEGLWYSGFVHFILVVRCTTKWKGTAFSSKDWAVLYFVWFCYGSSQWP